MPPVPSQLVRPIQQQEKPLSHPKIRVLRALDDIETDDFGNGWVKDTDLAILVGCKALRYLTVAIGRIDPQKRAAYEQHKECGGSPGNPSLSLLSLGYVIMQQFDIDGKAERVYSITGEGRHAIARLAHVHLDPITPQEEL